MEIDTSNMQELAEGLLSLPAPSRAFLVDKLVESIDDYVDPEVEAAWREEVERRLAEYEDGKVEGIPSEEVFRVARERLNEARQIPS